MAGTGWQSSDLLARFNAMAGRPTTDAILDADKYRRLADAQDTVLGKISTVAKSINAAAPVTMATSDGGYTWTFGTDGNGYATFALGGRIYPTLSAIPDYPWIPGTDYLDEGTQVRMPNNVPWGGPLYWYGVIPPQQMSASVQPIIQPPPARILIVIEAVRTFAQEYLRNAALTDEMSSEWERQWPNWITAIRKHLRGGRWGGRAGFLGVAGVGRW